MLQKKYPYQVLFLGNIKGEMAAAQRATGIHASAIGALSAGIGKTAGGFIWKWKTTKE